MQLSLQRQVSMVRRGEISERLTRRAVEEVQRHARRARHRNVAVFGFSGLDRFVVKRKLDVHSRSRTFEQDFVLHGSIMHLAGGRQNCG
jgi:hypothetical protein